MAQVLSDIFNHWFGTDIKYYWYIAIGELIIILPLCYLRDIKVFSNIHIIGDIAVLAVVISLGYAAISGIVEDPNWDFGRLDKFRNDWFKVLGMCVTSLEGIGVLLPVKVFKMIKKANIKRQSSFQQNNNLWVINCICYYRSFSIFTIHEISR